MNRLKKITALVLVFALSLSIFSVPVFASSASLSSIPWSIWQKIGELTDPSSESNQEFLNEKMEELEFRTNYI